MALSWGLTSKARTTGGSKGAHLNALQSDSVPLLHECLPSQQVRSPNPTLLASKLLSAVRSFINTLMVFA